jgi:hypothetical protein
MSRLEGTALSRETFPGRAESDSMSGDLIHMLPGILEFLEKELPHFLVSLIAYL